MRRTRRSDRQMVMVGVALFLLAAAGGWSQTTAQLSSVVIAEPNTLTGGVVNWTHGYIEASGSSAFPERMSTGRAKLMARRGAMMDAQRSLLETILGVQVTAESTMRDFVVESDEVRTRVHGTLRGAKLVHEQIDRTDGLYEVVMRVSLRDIAEIAHHFEKPLLREHPEWSPAVVEQDDIVRREREPDYAPYRYQPDGPYSGLVIDCRGLDLRPSMSPKIRSDDGREIWGTVNVPREDVIRYGIVGYLRDIRDLDHPAIVARCGRRPLLVRAIGVAGTRRADPVLSAEDAGRVLRANRRDGFLDTFSVAFLK